MPAAKRKPQPHSQSWEPQSERGGGIMTLESALEREIQEHASHKKDSDDDVDGSPVSIMSRRGLGGALVAARGPAVDPSSPEGNLEAITLPDKVGPRKRMVGNQGLHPGGGRKHEKHRKKDGKRKTYRERVSEMDPTELAVGSVIIFMTGFAFVVFLLLVLFSMRYILHTVNATREWYVLHGSAAWAKAKATTSLRAAEQVWHALDAAATYGILNEVTRYTSLEQVLAPVFMAASHVREVELDFGGSPHHVVHVGRDADDYNQLEIRTNDANCFLLGSESCLFQVTAFADKGAGLQPSEARWEREVFLRPYQIALPTRQGDGQLIPLGREAWFLTSRLYFRLPDIQSVQRSGTTVNSGVIGRLSIVMTELFSDGLQDSQLGDDGRVFLCNEAGLVLATRGMQEILIINESYSSTLQAKPIWTLGTSWAQSLESVFSAGIGNLPDSGKVVDHPDVSIVVQRLEGVFDSFAVVVVAPDWGAFANDTLFLTSFISIGLVSLLLSIICIIGMCVTCRKAPKEALHHRLSVAMARGSAVRQGFRTSVGRAMSRARMKFAERRDSPSMGESSTRSTEVARRWQPTIIMQSPD